MFLNVGLKQDGAKKWQWQFEFSASPRSLSFSSDGGSKSTTITSRRRRIYLDDNNNANGSFGSWESCDFSVSESLSWITTSTSGNTVSFNASENTSTSRSESATIEQSRSGYYQYTGSDYPSDSGSIPISLSQSAGVTYSYSLSVSPTSIFLPPSGRYRRVTINSSKNGSDGSSEDSRWVATKDASWISCSPSSGTGIYSDISGQNYTNPAQDRTGKVTIEQEDSGKTETIDVTQRKLIQYTITNNLGATLSGQTVEASVSSGSTSGVISSTMNDVFVCGSSTTGSFTVNFTNYSIASSTVTINSNYANNSGQIDSLNSFTVNVNSANTNNLTASVYLVGLSENLWTIDISF